MAEAVRAARSALTLEYLCQILERSGLLTDEQRREALARGDVTHARLLRQRAGGPRKRGAGAGEGVHPAEVLASMGLGQAGGPPFPLGRRRINPERGPARGGARRGLSPFPVYA